MKTLLFTIFIVSCMFTANAQHIDLSLQKCKEMAVENNENIKIARYQNEQARVEKQSAFTAYLPKFAGSATYAYMYGNMEMDLPEIDLIVPIMGMEMDMSYMIPQNVDLKINTDVYMIGVNVQQPIFAGGKIIAGNQMAKKGIEITDENMNLTRMNVIADAEKAYWNYFLIQDKIELLKQYESLLDTLYYSISDMVSVQMATDAELLKISSRKSNIQYQIQKATNGLELSRMQLCRIIGIDLNTNITLSDTLAKHEHITTQTSHDINLRPEYKILQKQLELKDLNVKMVRGDYLPTFGIMAGYSYMGKIHIDDMSIKMNEPMPIIMASLSIPIFHFGEGAKKIQSAKIAKNIQQEECNKNEKLLQIEMQYVTRSLEEALLLITTADIALEQAETNLKQSQDNYDVGMGTLLDVLDAQTQWQEAYSNSIEAKIDYKIKEIEYLKAMGTLE